MKKGTRGRKTQWLTAVFKTVGGRTIVFPSTGPNAEIRVVVMSKGTTYTAILPGNIIHDMVRLDKLKAILPSTVTARSIVWIRHATNEEIEAVGSDDQPPTSAPDHASQATVETQSSAGGTKPDTGEDNELGFNRDEFGSIG